MKAITLLLLAGCIPTGRPSQTIYIPENYTGKFDARNGDVVIEILNPRSEADMLAHCNDVGGELISNPYTLIWTCEGVDF